MKTLKNKNSNTTNVTTTHNQYPELESEPLWITLTASALLAGGFVLAFSLAALIHIVTDLPVHAVLEDPKNSTSPSKK